MAELRSLEPGAMFWAGKDPLLTVREMKGLGVRCGQLGLPGELALNGGEATLWQTALAAESFTLVTLFASYTGESYADIPTVQRTVGFIPTPTRAEREARTVEMSDFAARLGVPGIACHIGFVPPDHEHPDYVAVREMVRRICRHAQQYGQTFALETGQEPAVELKAFFEDVGEPNLRINFDPANMILYGTGDPIEALGVLAPYVSSVHAKDGKWPDPHVPGVLGTEVPLGKGDVGMERYVAKLREIGFTGPLNVERETESYAEKLADMKMGVALLERLLESRG